MKPFIEMEVAKEKGEGEQERVTKEGHTETSRENQIHKIRGETDRRAGRQPGRQTGTRKLREVGEGGKRPIDTDRQTYK